MKIVAGLGSVDEYIRYCEAGADEFFCGYVPYKWTKKYGTMIALNRREVLCCNVQIGGEEELEILASMIRVYQKPVHLTFNSLYYLPEQYPLIGQMISNCLEMGFRSYIIADPALILYLHEQGINCEIHLSGETAEVNSRMSDVFDRLDVERLIFHRKNSFADMESVIRHEREKGSRGVYEFEAFALNELCQFSGAFCNSLHCDEMGHLCRVPYQIGKVKGNREKIEECLETEKLISRTESSENDANDEQSTDKPNEDDEERMYDTDGYLCGATGCGLCALYRLQKAGITHLKLVGRGNYVDFMEKDIRNLKTALDILEHVDTEEEYKPAKDTEVIRESGGVWSAWKKAAHKISRGRLGRWGSWDDLILETDGQDESTHL